MARNYKYIKRDNCITIDNIDQWNPGTNMVLVTPAIDTSVVGDKVKFHIDTYFGEIEHAQRVVKVIKVPHGLAIKNKILGEKNVNALDWDTDMELQVGDIAWVDPLAVVSNNNTSDTTEIICNNKLFFAIRYDKFIAVKRDDKKFTVNGYVLYEQIADPTKSFIYNKPEYFRSVIKCIGTPNRSYYGRNQTDAFPLEIGDIIHNPKYHIPLEHPLHRVFDKETSLYCTQRRNIPFKYSSDGFENSNTTTGQTSGEKKQET